MFAIRAFILSFPLTRLELFVTLSLIVHAMCDQRRFGAEFRTAVDADEGLRTCMSPFHVPQQVLVPRKVLAANRAGEVLFAYVHLHVNQQLGFGRERIVTKVAFELLIAISNSTNERERCIQNEDPNPKLSSVLFF